jgi:hypothetical protein
LKVEIEYQKSEPDLVNDIAGTDSTAIEKPVITKVDGITYKEGMTVKKDGFAITGTIKGADAVWVDDFKLGKFQTGDTAWTYNIKVSYGNLKPGLNSYQVYGVTEDGKKSPILTVKINYEAPPVAAAVTTTPVTTTTATTTANTETTSAPATITAPVTVTSPEKPLNS